MKAPNIIFLDIDGVVNTHNHLKKQKLESGTMDSRNWCPAACKSLMLLCRQFDARIVISSSWRFEYTLAELRRLCAKNGINPKYVIGVTPTLIYDQQHGYYRRGDEIRRWLQEHPYGSYVILDDVDASLFLEEQQKHLIKLEAQTGFADKEAAIRAAEVLGGG